MFVYLLGSFGSICLPGWDAPCQDAMNRALGIGGKKEAKRWRRLKKKRV